MKATKLTPVAHYHTGGLLFAGDQTYYPEGWYVFDGETATPLAFAEDYETQERLTEA